MSGYLDGILQQLTSAFSHVQRHPKKKVLALVSGGKPFIKSFSLSLSSISKEGEVGGGREGE